MHPHDLEDALVSVARVHLGQFPHFTSLRALAADVGVTSDGLERALALLGIGLREIEWQARYEPRCAFRNHAKLGCVRVEAPRGARNTPAALALQERIAPYLRRAALASVFEPLIERIHRGEVVPPGPDKLKIKRTHVHTYRLDELPPELLPDVAAAPLFRGLLAARGGAGSASPSGLAGSPSSSPAGSAAASSAAAGLAASSAPSMRSEAKIEPGSRVEVVEVLREPEPEPKREPLVPFVALDTETTGFSSESDRVIWVALVTFDETGSPVHIWDTPINPGRSVPYKVQELTGIKPAELARAPRFEDVARQLHQRLTGQVVVAHNLSYDKRMLCAEFDRVGKLGPAWKDVSVWPDTAKEVCTQAQARRIMPKGSSLALDAVAGHFGVKMGRHHRAVGDATVCGRVWVRMGQAMTGGEGWGSNKQNR